MSARLTIATKEIRDHLRDRRSLVSAAMFSLMGPAVILLVSQSAAASKGGPAVLLGMMSVFTLVSSFTGGMYLAMDSTAGERERGSLVPLLLNPVSRLDLVIGKWLAASAFALAGLALNLAGFTLAFAWAGVVPPGGFSRVFLLWTVCGLVPLALLGAALDLLAAATCRTTKEAHVRLTIVTFVPMIVGMALIFFPGWVGRWWYALPVVGQQALIGAGLRGDVVSAVQSATLGVVTIAIAALALHATARAFDRDEILAA
jgi:sodium transport system permease protein